MEKIFFRKAAKNPFEAFPLGNGHIGALVFGNPHNETVLLNDDMLWSGNGKQQLNEKAYNAYIRAKELMREGEAARVHRLVESDMLGNWSESYMPLGTLKIHFTEQQKPIDYKRQLFLDNGVCETVWSSGKSQITVRSFVSFPDDVFVMEMNRVGIGGMSVTVALDSQLRHTVDEYSGMLHISGASPDHVIPNYVPDISEPVIYDNYDGMHFAAFAGITAVGGSIRFENGTAVIEQALSVRIVYSSLTDRAGADYADIAVGRVKSALLRGQKLYSLHVSDFSEHYCRVSFQLDSGNDELPMDERIRRFRADGKDTGLQALLFSYGRYLLLCSARQGLPANLQGIWNWDIRPAWSANYTTNINLEMNYWPCEITNLSECGNAFSDWMQTLLDNAEAVARVHYGKKGACIHHNIDGWGMCTPASGDAQFAFWPMSGVWMSKQVFAHYQYTGDEAFLRDKAYPILRDMVLFCTDWLEKNSKGEYVSVLSTSPENLFLIPGCEKPLGVCEMTACDILLIGSLLENYLEAVRIIGRNDELNERAEECLNGLKKLTVIDGMIAEWSEPLQEFDPGHRHLSPLIGIYPGTDELTDPVLYEASHRLFDRRIENGCGQLGWSAAWSAAVCARFREPDEADKYLSNIVKYCVSPNLFNIYISELQYPESRGDGHRNYENSELFWFQIDGNFGYTAAVAEMLLQDCREYIELLPCLPDKWSKGHILGLRAKNDITIDQFFENGCLEHFVLRFGSNFKGSSVTVRYKDNQAVLHAVPGYVYEANSI